MPSDEEPSHQPGVDTSPGAATPGDDEIVSRHDPGSGSAPPPLDGRPAPAPPPTPEPPPGETARLGSDVPGDDVPDGEVESPGDQPPSVDGVPAAVPRTRARRSGSKRLLEWVALIALALGVAFLLRTFVVQSFYIPSTSMTPTLQVGDRVLVNKLAYRLGDPGRGDIIVFEAPPGESNGGVKDLIKRVVGLPGETIEGRDGDLFIDGERIDEPWLPPGITARTFGPETIPDDHYWVLGDNRFDSRDSTFFKSIPRDSIVGKAFLRIWPLDEFGGL